MTRKFHKEPPEKSGLLHGYPTREMLFAKRPPKLTANKIDGSYKDVEEYLDVHRKLLLEDFMNPLRKALRRCKNDPKCNYTEGARIYRNVVLSVPKSRILQKECIYILSGIATLAIQFQTDGEKEPSFGHLLLFTQKNFHEHLILGKVASDKTGVLEVKLESGATYPLACGKYNVLQPEAFYFKYEHILRALDTFNKHNFPMEEYIVYGSKQEKYPAYFKRTTRYNVFGHSVHVLSTEGWPYDPSMGIDESQFLALKRALTRRVAVIQGPPGTGKTYFGIKTVKVLLDNIQAWNPTLTTPLLVVCQSNRALDHFLEGLLTFTTKLVRVGDQSESVPLKPYFLHNLVSKQLMVHRGRGGAVFRGTTTREVLASAHVVGMTTTGASFRREHLEMLKSPIVIVDEAAQVIEADVVASMTHSSQHIIMLGDHKQLRPITTTQHLASKFKLDVSLFERLVNNKGVTCLTTQYRMRPEISSLLKPHIYEKLDNASATFDYPPIKGIAKSVFFFHHGGPEDSVHGEHGYFNSFEAKMLIKLAKYLVSVGHKASQITIIAMYVQQRNKLDEVLQREKQRYPDLGGLEIATVDSFQGRENDIILLSLVRNNSAGDVGFLREETRTCVALSRARKGLYIMGNKTCFEKQVGTVWDHVLERLRDQDAIGTKINLFCEIHSKSLEVARIEDWNDDFCGDCFVDRKLRDELKEQVEKLRDLVLGRTVSHTATELSFFEKCRKELEDQTELLIKQRNKSEPQKQLLRWGNAGPLLPNQKKASAWPLVEQKMTEPQQKMQEQKEERILEQKRSEAAQLLRRKGRYTAVCLSPEQRRRSWPPL